MFNLPYIFNKGYNYLSVWTAIVWALLIKLGAYLFGGHANIWDCLILSFILQLVIGAISAISRGYVKRTIALFFVTILMKKNRGMRMAVTGSLALYLKGIVPRKPNDDIDIITDIMSIDKINSGEIKLPKFFKIKRRANDSYPIESKNGTNSSHYYVYLFNIKMFKLDFFEVGSLEFYDIDSSTSVWTAATEYILDAKKRIAIELCKKGEYQKSDKHFYDIYYAEAWMAGERMSADLVKYFFRKKNKK